MARTTYVCTCEPCIYLLPSFNQLTLQRVLCLFGVVVFKLHRITIFAFSWRNIARNRITNYPHQPPVICFFLRKIRTQKLKNSRPVSIIRGVFRRGFQTLQYLSSGSLLSSLKTSTPISQRRRNSRELFLTRCFDFARNGIGGKRDWRKEIQGKGRGLKRVVDKIAEFLIYKRRK